MHGSGEQMEHEQVIRAVALREAVALRDYGHALSDDEVDAVVWLTDCTSAGTSLRRR
jgi:hypothetical protein